MELFTISKKSGRPRVTTPGQDHYINRMHTKNRFRNDALESGKIPVMRRITGHTVRKREINPCPTGLQ